MFVTVLFPAFCSENKDMNIQRFSAISVIDCKSAFDFVTKPGAPTGVDDKRCCRRRMARLFVGPTGLMLGDALTKTKLMLLIC